MHSTIAQALPKHLLYFTLPLLLFFVSLSFSFLRVNQKGAPFLTTRIDTLKAISKPNLFIVLFYKTLACFVSDGNQVLDNI